jgi:hypothetical protein
MRPRGRYEAARGLDHLASRHHPGGPATLGLLRWDVPTQIFHGDVLFIKWSAVSDAKQVSDGIDTFVFSDDGIRVQTVRYTLTG